MKRAVAAVVVVLCGGPVAISQTVEIEKKPPAVIVKNAAGNIAASIAIGKGDRVVSTVGSLDNRFLFLAVRKHGGAGALNVVDLQAGTAISRALVNHPTRLLRLGPKQELWVLGDAMRSISENGKVGDPIPLRFEGGGFAWGQLIAVGADRAAISLTNLGAKTLYRVALIDLKQRRVDGVVQTRSAGQKAELGGSHFGKDILKGLATAGTATVHTTYFDYYLAARPDGRFVYAVDFGTHEVTAIDVPTTTKATTIKLDKSASKAQVSPDGKELICTGKQVQKIDLASNRMEN